MLIDAVDAIGRFGRHGVPSLIEVLADNDRNVRISVIKALGNIREDAKRDIPTIIEFLSDDYVRESAKQALEKIPSAKRKTPEEVTTTSGLKYIDLKVGKGESPRPGQQVTVHYIGWLEDGTKFNSSLDRGKPFEFVMGVGWVIGGWDEGIMTMKVGGIRTLIIPPSLGYGPRGMGSIPPNSTLIFEVELLGIN